ncbi:MAG: hypothetical protein K9N55_05800 [Phycisphaerae bacterium]|nr:hypothetical protein [Phycisphaerae bacterium]
MCRKRITAVLALSLFLISSASAAVISWDFENGNDHGFILWSINPPIPGEDDPNTAGDEALTGGLPDAGVAWNIGTPDQFDGQKGAGDPSRGNYDANGLLNLDLGTQRMTRHHGFLNTYSLNQHGDYVHTPQNDQIATSPLVNLGEGAILTAIVAGSGAPTEPILDPNPALGYADGSGGIAVRSAMDGTILASTKAEGKGGEDAFVLDLSAFAGQQVYIEVVDAHDGGWGWIAVDKIEITNARVPGQAVLVTNAASMAGYDHAMVDRLVSLGYEVTIIDSKDPKNGVFTVEEAESLDLIIVSEVISSSDANPLAGANVPIMNGEGYGWHKVNYAESDGSAGWKPVNDPNGNPVTIIDDSHWIVVDANLTAGPIAYLQNEDATTTCAAVSSLAPGAVNIASIVVDDIEYALIFAIEAGAQLAKDPNNIAANRIVGFSLPGNQDPNLSNEGWALFDAAIRWLDPAPQAGLITKAPDQLAGFDQQMFDRLEFLGYAVEIIASGDVKGGAFTVADAEAFDVIVVSESISSSDVSNLAGANVPMMNGEGYGWHKMNYAESDGSASWQDANDLVDVVNETHPIIVDAALSVGTMEYLLDEKASATTASATSLAPGAEGLVSITIDGTEYALIFAIDKDAELAKGAGPAANRIVGFSLPGNTPEGGSNVLSDDGWALFEASIRWLDAIDD